MQLRKDGGDESGDPVARVERLVADVPTDLAAANDALRAAVGEGRAAAEAAARLYAAAQASEEFVRRLIASSPDCIKVLDLDGRLLAMSENGRRLLEIADLGKYLDTCWTDWWRGDDHRAAAAAVAEAARGGTGRFVAFAPTANGTPKWWDVAVTPILGPDGSPERLLSVSRDVTDQRARDERLRASEAHLRLVFQSITDYAIFTTDSNGIVTSWNPGAEHVFRCAASEIVGRSSDLLWTPEDLANDAPAAERRVAVAQGCADDERWHRRPDGSRFYAAGATRPLRDGAGHPIGFTKVCRDVTARREAERQLAAAQGQVAAAVESERSLLADVFKRSPSFMAVLRGPRHVFEMANDRYYELVGHRPVVGKAVRDALPEVEGQGFFELLDGVYATGEPFVGRDMRLVIQREPNGPLDERFVEFVYQALRAADGSVTGVFAHGIDLTEHKRAELAVRESESQFRQLADAMPQIVWAARPDGTVDYYNRKWYEYTGMAEGEVGDPSWEPVLPPEDVNRVRQVWGEALRTGQPYGIEYRFRRGSDGQHRWHLGRALPVRDADGHVVRWFGTNTDVHDYKLLQEQNQHLLDSERAARAEAERAGRTKDEFLATLSHELRTPLNAILGWSQILRGGGGGEVSAADLGEGLGAIERNARAQTQIIEDLLDMSRIVSGKVRLDVRRLDLAAVVRAGIDTVRPAADAKGVRVQAVLDPVAGPVSGDPNRLHQVFWNLLTNAVKFTPRGGRVQVLLERVNSHVEVSVIDTGEGIAAEFLPHVFDRFRQADASTTRRHGGLGLGLSIVKQLVELHGGRARVKSAGVGLGTTFVVDLPLVVVHPEPEPAADEAKREHPAAGVPADLHGAACLRLPGVRVLVVDDEPDARAVVRRLLEDCGAVVRTAASAAEAFELFQSDPPDVLVSDIGMPGEDGYSLVRRVRAMGKDRGGGTPALALTAYARPEDRMRAVRAGFHMHVAKPVEPAELITMVASLAGRNEG